MTTFAEGGRDVLFAGTVLQAVAKGWVAGSRSEQHCWLISRYLYGFILI